jgi:hypothetical protein
MNVNDQLLLLKKFPLIVPQNREFTLYRGFFQVGVRVEYENKMSNSLLSLLSTRKTYVNAE